MYAINNGILTSALFLVVSILASANPDNYIFFALYMIIGNLYANSALATLNIRNSLKSMPEDGRLNLQGGASHLSTPMVSGQTDDSFRLKDLTRSKVIQIRKTTDIEHDDGHTSQDDDVVILSSSSKHQPSRTS
ncbi:hypothetical protein HGRIS_005919 [Hohenbuehelia grisea]|uniref:DUF6534 domain-containing protein n=1 Tax=Hohenbuehelia grisea TaxID=104357 RepID=A0ABR3K0F4_9AGAR